MKRAAIDAAGHLRLHYGDGNEAVKGPLIDLPLGSCEMVHPASPDESFCWKRTEQGLRLESRRERWLSSPGRPTSILLLPGSFDFDQGVVSEAVIRVDDTIADDAVKTHVPPSAFPPAGPARSACSSGRT